MEKPDHVYIMLSPADTQSGVTTLHTMAGVWRAFYVNISATRQWMAPADASSRPIFTSDGNRSPGDRRDTIQEDVGSPYAFRDDLYKARPANASAAASPTRWP